MCIVGANHVIDAVAARARLITSGLEDTPEAAPTATRLRMLLEQSVPLVQPLTRHQAGQITAAAVVALEPREYPALLEHVVGPPLRVGPEGLLGHVVAECALSALRQGDLQATLAALFLTTLCASQLEGPAEEALHHLLVESDGQDLIGLFEIGGLRTQLSRQDLLALRRRQGLKFVTTAVQLRGTFGARTVQP